MRRLPFDEALCVADSAAEVLDILSFNPKPQVTIRGQGWTVRPDLVDVRLGIALEANSFEWHGSRDALSADARRYDLMVAAGWLVLRFSYEHVMTQPDFVRRVTTDVVVRAERMTQVGLRITTAA